MLDGASLGVALHAGNALAGHAAMTSDVMVGHLLDRYPGSRFPSRPAAPPTMSPIDLPVDRAHAHLPDFLRIDIDAAQMNELRAQFGSLVSTDDGRLT